MTREWFFIGCVLARTREWFFGSFVCARTREWLFVGFVCARTRELLFVCFMCVQFAVTKAAAHAVGKLILHTSVFLDFFAQLAVCAIMDEVPVIAAEDFAVEESQEEDITDAQEMAANVSATGACPGPGQPPSLPACFITSKVFSCILLLLFDKVLSKLAPRQPRQPMKCSCPDSAGCRRS